MVLTTHLVVHRMGPFWQQCIANTRTSHQSIAGRVVGCVGGLRVETT